MNYVIRRPDLTDYVVTAAFAVATIIAAANLPAVLAAMILVNSIFILAGRINQLRARSRAFRAIGAIEHLPIGVTAVALVIPTREPAL